jgi:hypothetical protein
MASSPALRGGWGLDICEDSIDMTNASRSQPAAAPQQLDASAPAAVRPKLVYVLGTGRSGSTILGIALGNCEGIFYAGELHLWLGRAGKPPLKGAERERFWDAVREQVTPGMSAAEVRSLEQSTAVFDIRGRRARRRLRKRYREIAADLCQAVARTAGATHVVDTSHFPRRARQLQALDSIDLYVILLVRDPQAVVASYSRDDRDFPRFNTVTTNLYMWLTHLLSLFVFLRHPRDRRLLVHYESFIEQPERVLGEIFATIDARVQVPDLDAMQTGVAFQGNPLLRSDVVALKRDLNKPRSSRVTSVLQLPWLAVCSLLRPAAASAGTEPRASRDERTAEPR